VLHTMYYGNEVRDFKQVPKGENVKISETELELGVGLIDRLTSEEFKSENYKGEYCIRVLGILDEKSKGKEIVIGKAPAPKHGQVFDLMEALKPSMEECRLRRNRHRHSNKEEKKSVLGSSTDLLNQRRSFALSSLISFGAKLVSQNPHLVSVHF